MSGTSESRLSGSAAAPGLRGFSGVVTGGVVALTLVVIGTSFLGADRGFPGPGAVSISAHIAAAAAAIVTQVWMDRRGGTAAALGSLTVSAIAGLLLWSQWWS